MDLPFAAQYSEIGSSCKGCVEHIPKSSLRLAAKVQSNFHDGKQYNWFHLNCFFKKQRPKTIGDIEDIENLRYDDQKIIEKKIANISMIVLPSSSIGNKRSSNDAALKDFSVEYAKSGRSKCRGCENIILKGEVRISKITYETEVGMKYGGEPRWHHVDCFVQLRDSLGYFESGVKLPNFQLLTKSDQEMIKKQIPVKYDIPDAKKSKTIDKIEIIDLDELEIDTNIKIQNDQLFKYRDQLKKYCDLNNLCLLLKINKQNIPNGISVLEKILNITSDLLLFGALLPCTNCNGQFELTKGGYICKGNLNEWTKCMNLVKEPPRIPCKIPDKLKIKYKFLENYISIVQHRIIKYIPPSGPIVYHVRKEGEGPAVKREKPKLNKMEFVIFDKTNKTKDEIKKIITSMGGKLVTKLHKGTSAVISNHDAVEKMHKRMRDIQELDIHVVTDNYLDEVKISKMDAYDLIIQKNICSWGTDTQLKNIQTKDNEYLPKESIYSKFVKPNKKVTLKNGSAVDPDSKLQHIAHVYEFNGVKFNATLTCTDLRSGKNSYYYIQLLEADKEKCYWVFQSWGRVGTTIGSNKKEKFYTLYEAEMMFEQYYYEKSKNSWENRDNFVKKPDGYYPIDIDYSEDNNFKTITEESTIKSNLDEPKQDLMKLIFDVDLMKKTLLEFELDTVKMPLGKLSKKQMQTAYKVLTELSNLITKSGSQSEFITLSNQFYTLIPHSCGVNLPPVLDKVEMIKNKIEMLDSMMEIELAYSLLNTKVDETINPIDAHYQQLNTEMETLDHNSEEFKMLFNYVQTTHAETHKTYDLEILDVFKVKREGEENRYKPFKKLHNRKLLWHGSRLTNYVGILSYGLKIAPPEAPSTGYMFGKGIYFADMVSKSANYCVTNPTDTTGLILLCEVALGDMLELNRANSIEKLPNNKHSTKGIGQTYPDPLGSIIRSDGSEIPCGKPITNKKLNTSLLYNEYIVYDVAQVNVQYLLKMNFKYK